MRKISAKSSALWTAFFIFIPYSIHAQSRAESLEYIKHVFSGTLQTQYEDRRFSISSSSDCVISYSVENISRSNHNTWERRTFFYNLVNFDPTSVKNFDGHTAVYTQGRDYIILERHEYSKNQISTSDVSLIEQGFDCRGNACIRDFPSSHNQAFFERFSGSPHENDRMVQQLVSSCSGQPVSISHGGVYELRDLGNGDKGVSCNDGTSTAITYNSGTYCAIPPDARTSQCNSNTNFEQMAFWVCQ